MEANAPTLRVDINQLERVKRVFELISSWPSKFAKEKLVLTRLNSSSAHPEPVNEGTRTDYCKDQAVFDEGAEPFLSVWYRHIFIQCHLPQW